MHAYRDSVASAMYGTKHTIWVHLNEHRKNYSLSRRAAADLQALEERMKRETRNQRSPEPCFIPIFSPMIRAYLFPGLGADRRAFAKMPFPEGYEVHVLEYPEAMHGEAFEALCVRMGAPIKRDAPFVLIGHSLGGMVAAELTPALQPLKTILISSASSSLELPPYYRWMLALKMPYIIPPVLFKQPTPMTHWVLGAKKKENKELNGAMLRDFPSSFFTWAFRHIPQWKRKERPGNIFQLHGTADRILPLRYVKPDVVIPKGTHLMFLENPEVAGMIYQQLEEIRMARG